MSRTPIQVPIELKEKLEERKRKERYNSIPDVIYSLLAFQEKTLEQKQKEQIKQLEDQNRREREDVHLGAEIKQKLTEFQQAYDISSPARAVEFLISAFQEYESIGRITLKTLVSVRRKS